MVWPRGGCEYAARLLVSPYNAFACLLALPACHPACLPACQLNSA
jgi:hypothetical protein